MLPGMPASTMLKYTVLLWGYASAWYCCRAEARCCAGRYQQMPALEIRELLDLEMAIMVRLCAVQYWLAVCS